MGEGGLEAEQAELRDVKVLQGLRPGSPPEPRLYDAVPIAAAQPPPPTSPPPANVSKC